MHVVVQCNNITSQDDVHFEKYKALGKQGRKRNSDYKLFFSAASSHRRKLCTRLELPEGVKNVLRSPAHEEKWEKLEDLRAAIARSIFGEKLFEVETEQDAAELVRALESNTSDFPDALTGHSIFPDGSRIVVDEPPKDLTASEQRAIVCNAIMNSVGRSVSIRTRLSP